MAHKATTEDNLQKERVSERHRAHQQTALLQQFALNYM